jgi:predicted N-acetyltransferase YhbS
MLRDTADAMTVDTAPAVTVRELEAGVDTGTFRELYDQVLAPSFRESELVESEVLAEAVTSDRVIISVAVGPGGTVLGGMIADWYDDTRVLLLSYLAVRPGLRGRGIGHALIDATVPALRARLDPLVVLGEVEDPRYFSDTRFGDAVARLRLYQRYGARFLPLPYLQPEVRPGHGRVPNLLLTVFLVDEAACPAPGFVDGTVIDRFLERYFTEHEGPAQPDDVALAELRAACRRPGGLPLLDVAQVI